MYYRRNNISLVYIIIGINAFIFFLANFGLKEFINLLALSPFRAVFLLHIWEFITHFFVHFNFQHLFWNMFIFFMIAVPLERLWGTKKFITFYLLSGTVTGILAAIVYITIGKGNIYLIGASGAIYALLVGFAFTLPEAQILLFFILPIKAKYIPFVYLVIDLFLAIRNPNSNISYYAHIIGLGVGYIFFRTIIVKKSNISRESAESIDNRKSITKKQIAFFINMCLYKLSNNVQFSQNDIELLLKLSKQENNVIRTLCNENEFDSKAIKCEKCNDIVFCILRELKNRGMV